MSAVLGWLACRRGPSAGRTCECLRLPLSRIPARRWLRRPAWLGRLLRGPLLWCSAVLVVLPLPLLRLPLPVPRLLLLLLLLTLPLPPLPLL